MMANSKMVEEVLIKCEPLSPDYQGSHSNEHQFTENDNPYPPFEEVLVKTEQPIKSEGGGNIKTETTSYPKQEFKPPVTNVLIEEFKPPVTNVLIERAPSDQELVDKKIFLKQEVLPQPSSSKLLLNSPWNKGIQTRRQRFLSERRGSPPIGKKQKGKEKSRRKRLFYSTDVGETCKFCPASLTEAADKVTTAINEMTDAINMLAKANDKLAKAKLLQTKLEIARAQAAGLHVSIVHE